MKRFLWIPMIALLLCACTDRQKSDAVTEPAAQNEAEVVNALIAPANGGQSYPFGGIYAFGDTADKEARSGKAYIYPLSETVFLFYFYVSSGAPTYTMGGLDGHAVLSAGKGVYRKLFDFAAKECVVHFEFADNAVNVIEQAEYGCGFGELVAVNDRYEKISAEMPKTYLFSNTEERSFSNLADLLAMEEDLDGGSDQLQAEKSVFYEGKSINDAYAIFVKNSSFGRELRKTLPAKDTKDQVEIDGVKIDVEYAITKEKVRIVILHDGGETRIELERGKTGTTSTVFYAAD